MYYKSYNKFITCLPYALILVKDYHANYRYIKMSKNNNMTLGNN